MKAVKKFICNTLSIFAFIFLIFAVKELISKHYKDFTIYFVLLIVSGKLLSLLDKPKKTDEMTGREYELYCAKYLLGRGFRKVQTTPITGDYGADLTAKDWRGNSWVFQCKRYKGTVGVQAVQEVCAARKHYNANRAAVITNSKFTKNAKQLAMENDIELFEMIDD